MYPTWICGAKGCWAPLACGTSRPLNNYFLILILYISPWPDLYLYHSKLKQHTSRMKFEAQEFIRKWQNQLQRRKTSKALLINKLHQGNINCLRKLNFSHATARLQVLYRLVVSIKIKLKKVKNKMKKLKYVLYINFYLWCKHNLLRKHKMKITRKWRQSESGWGDCFVSCL